MWNSIAPALANGDPRPGMPPQGAGQNVTTGPAASREMAQMERQAGAPQAPGGAPAGGPQMPAEFQPHVDPNNQMQATLIQRGHQLAPQESQAFAAGIDVPALNVLKKLVPELGFLWDKIIQLKGQAGAAPAPGAPPMPGAPGAPPPAMPQAGQQPPPPQRLAAQTMPR